MASAFGVNHTSGEQLIKSTQQKRLTDSRNNFNNCIAHEVNLQQSYS